MKKITEWLIRIEDTAYKVYKNAAYQFSGDREFSEFLNCLSKDEKEHYDFVCEAKEYLADNPDYPSLISLDDDTKQKIELPLKECKKKINTGKITKEELINYIVAIEYSELNPLFLYAIGTLKGFSRKYLDVAKSIKRHKKYIENFIGKQPEEDEWVKKISKLLKVGKAKILVVSDNQIVVELLRDILVNNVVIESVPSSEEALTKISDKYYAAIIWDVEKPVLTRLDLYDKAIERFPIIIKKRFLFFATATESEYFSYFESNGLNYLIKPSSVNNLRKAVFDILIRDKIGTAPIYSKRQELRSRS